MLSVQKYEKKLSNNISKYNSRCAVVEKSIPFKLPMEQLGEQFMGESDHKYFSWLEFSISGAQVANPEFSAFEEE